MSSFPGERLDARGKLAASLRPGREAAPAPAHGISIRRLLIPVEHGGWGFLTEPLLLGLIVAPSWAAPFIVVFAFAMFLARQPLKLATSDRLRHKRYPRSEVAERWGAGLLATGLASLAAAAWLGGPWLLLPLLAAAPLAFVQFARDANNESRSIAAELAGTAAVGTTAAAIALAGGMAWPVAASLWALVAARALSAVIYVRSRIPVARGEGPRPLASDLAHLGALAIAALLWVAGTAPALAVAAFALLLIRAMIGARAPREKTIARRIGIGELVYGGLFVAIVGAGYIF